MAGRPDPRYTVHFAAAEALAGKPDIRPGLSVEMAADLLFGLLSPQLYLIFVRDRGWSPDTWEEWARTALTSQLCADPAERTDIDLKKVKVDLLEVKDY
ncbi:hypothetical protein NKG94_12470 [Micromonospora sp. M12]